MTTTEARWAERVRDWRASGKTAEAFAEGQQFEASTLRYWASRLKTAAPTTPAAVTAATKKVAMARVIRRRRSRPVARPADRAEIAVSVGAARITVGPGFDAELLRDVVAALGGGR
jgi:hypothetical protein